MLQPVTQACALLLPGCNPYWRLVHPAQPTRKHPKSLGGGGGGGLGGGGEQGVAHLSSTHSNQFALRQEGMQLNLVGHRLDPCMLQEILHLPQAEVGNPKMLHQAIIHHLLHSFPARQGCQSQRGNMKMRIKKLKMKKEKMKLEKQT